MSKLLYPVTLSLVTDLTLVPDWDDLCRRIYFAVQGGVSLVQIRAKTLSAHEQINLASRVVDLIGGRSQIVVNGSPEVAKITGADGVHLPETGASISSARSVLGVDALVGRSVHSAESAIKAESDGADYVFFGTVYSTGSHPNAPTNGVEGVREAASALTIPVIAIGGINHKNCQPVIAAGANGVAVITAIIAQRSSFQASRRLHFTINEAKRNAC